MGSLQSSYQGQSSILHSLLPAMAPSLAVKKRRDADRPPLLASATHHGTESKEKKKPVIGNSKPMEYIYWLVGLVWYGIRFMEATQGTSVEGTNNSNKRNLHQI